MKEIRVKASREYSVYISSGMDSLDFVLDSNRIRNIFVVTDENVYKIYNRVISGLKDRVIGYKVIKPGEDSKSPETIFSIYQELIKSNADKKTTIMSLGGGVVGDIAGFAASTFMRGTGLIHVATTLMSQCDSSIGGKNGYNYNNIKNIIGTFHQPIFVYNDVNFLKTLALDEFKNGLSEVVKYGFACDENLFKFLMENKRGILEREIDKLMHIVHEASRIKGNIIEKDELDSGPRQVLNFGHTVGHALESMSNFSVSHGQAVASGMRIEAYIAVRLGILQETYFNKLVNLLDDLGIKTVKDDLSVEELMSYMLRDKKKVAGNLKFALPVRIGNAIITSEIKPGTIENIIKEIIRR